MNGLKMEILRMEEKRTRPNKLRKVNTGMVSLR